ncbi:hypothetical protein RRV45_06310 [Bacillus sp. DTU_2020_1000418_1_SI_GHA_SEK_038]|uniref:hypothetical protein n=1 Tax=Bacillus sp. DTU_2020_1000418_1_SI_GHA_SEK_038 TaxID=3077585 RepID=UPI0028EA0CA3|nr:hypothetical protein [Bacillus sp. DTU_2020_1000418_1_SI_GHA_SEK_038]WNS76616.1 hypothetical protein RRV45_06310 [Bacillus sp. DTU_2020_1000418_1_SI_GHA_SEK_038]
MTNIPSSINKVFWGLILVLIDINIIIIDILPDIIGYFIAVSGLNQLQAYSSYFSKAKGLAISLALLSLVTIFQSPPIPLDEFSLSNMSLFVMVISMIHGIIHLFMVYYTILGLIEMAENEGSMLFAKSAKKGVRTYVIGTFASLAAVPFFMNVDDSAGFYIIGLSAITTIIMEIIILVLLRQFRIRFLTV